MDAHTLNMIMIVIHATITVLAFTAIVAKGYHETMVQHAGLFLVLFGGLGMTLGSDGRAWWVEPGYMAGIAIYGIGTGLKHRLKYLAAVRAQAQKDGDQIMFSRVRNWVEHVAGDAERLSEHQDTVVLSPADAAKLRRETAGSRT